MKRLFNLLKRKDGMVMVFVLCFMVLLFAIGTSVIVASDPLSASVQQNAYQEQAMLTSISYGGVIKAELAKDTSDLKFWVDNLLTDAVDDATLNANATERIGTATVTVKPVKNDRILATIESTYRGQKYKLNMVFQYSEVLEDDEIIGYTYTFTQYVPNN